jgi:hypothetical protein
VAKDRCYHKVKSSYKKFPSARASQAIAKCRGKSGKVRKTKKGAALKRWEKEKWKDTRTGKACGAKTKGKQYCRPTKRVSSKTPKTASQISPAKKRANIRRKSQGKRAKKV